MNKKRPTRVSDLIHQHAETDLYLRGKYAIRAGAVKDIRDLPDLELYYTGWKQATHEVGAPLNRSLENVFDNHNSTLEVCKKLSVKVR